MNLSMSGRGALAVEVSHISNFGVWLLTQKKELFMSYEDFPWFKNQTVQSIMNVEEQSKEHFYWADIDLTEKIIEHPERFPLKASIS